jgi:quercetin dioxygenase-like cupin family protein
MIIRIENKGILYAIIIDSSFSKPGVNFITPNESSLQIGYISQPKGKAIKAHYHKRTTRTLYYTNEVIILKQGKLRVDFYDNKKEYLESYILKAGDVMLLESGGHGFVALEDIEMVEVKQGPYVEDMDKDRFDGIKTKDVILNYE